MNLTQPAKHQPSSSELSCCQKDELCTTWLSSSWLVHCWPNLVLHKENQVMQHLLDGFKLAKVLPAITGGARLRAAAAGLGPCCLHVICSSWFLHQSRWVPRLNEVSPEGGSDRAFLCVRSC